MISRHEGFPEELAETERTARCPTCAARRTPGATLCHRCRSDLTLLVAVETRAAALHEEALTHYAEGRFRTALRLAADAARHAARAETLELLASAALRAGDYPAALAAARRRREGAR